eukprot:1897567-Pleurochrysis_carterae.AAC.1
MERLNAFFERSTRVRTKRKRRTAKMPERTGEMTQERMMPTTPEGMYSSSAVVFLVQTTQSLPLATMVMPIMPPTQE